MLVCRCNGCGYETPIFYVIDQWAKVDGKLYCRECCKEKGYGWYERN